MTMKRGSKKPEEFGYLIIILTFPNYKDLLTVFEKSPNLSEPPSVLFMVMETNYPAHLDHLEQCTR